MTSPRVRTVCVALLGQLTKLEEEIGELDFDGFSAFVDKLEVECDIEDKQSIFAMIDKDGGGTVDGFELKSAIRNSGAISGMYKESLQTFGYLVAATFAFDLGIYAFKGSEAAFDFLTAYFVEDSLSVDNLFVFLLLFRYFKVPPQLVDICLNYGITGSILLRGVFIFAGLAAASAFAPLLLGFSVFLIASSYTMLAGGEEEEEEDDAPPEIVTDLLDKLPMTGTFEGEKFFVNTPEGLRATQLTGTLVCIALCDVLFAVDSIPAVLGVTSDPFVVYTSNIAAVVGLRSLYQLLSIAVSDLVYLEKAVAIVLGFVGVKLGAEVLGVEVSSALSLGVIVTTLGGGVGLSLLASDEAKADYEPSPPGMVIKYISNIIGGKGDKGS
uniref:EF-hand domain-containing protein n=1 Tax=Phaeocystis antarctica TaxID=33657 RepID=A0A7S0DZJ5_9EUKA